jgi:hypothetical protein
LSLEALDVERERPPLFVYHNVSHRHPPAFDLILVRFSYPPRASIIPDIEAIRPLSNCELFSLSYPSSYNPSHRSVVQA